MATKSKHVKRPSWGQRSRRRERALIREQDRAKRSPFEQLRLLDTRRGESKRERNRLRTSMAEAAVQRSDALK